MPELFIGLMSGTSLDGIDAVLVDFSEQNWKLVASHAHPLPQEIKQAVLDLSLPGQNEIDRLGTLDRVLGQLFAESVRALVSKTGYKNTDIRAIGCHGQTIRHRPNLTPGFTLQIGDATTIAAITGINTIADFRKRDIAEGGEGAPLAPAFHQALLKTNGIKNNTCILNIGGMSNVTLVQEGNIQGFDTGPGNALIDGWTLRHLRCDFDEDGRWAASGRIHNGLLATLLLHPFFGKAPPKSTGREDFNLAWLDATLNQQQPIKAEDVQATLTELTAKSIADALGVFPRFDCLYICGGGAHNLHLLRRLRHHLPNTRIESTQALHLAPDWVEAAAFAWLAKRYMDGLPGNLPSVTGARKEAILGAFYPA